MPQDRYAHLKPKPPIRSAAGPAAQTGKAAAVQSRLLYVHALSPLHAGSGRSEGAVELAHQRDRATGHPVLPGSSLKGALRSCARGWSEETRRVCFGPETAAASEHAGALSVGDARMLLLPVRSMAGTFAWVTSPYLLMAHNRDLSDAGVMPLPLPVVGRIGDCVLSPASPLKVGAKVFFEDLDFAWAVSPEVTTLASRLAASLFPSAADQPWLEFFKGRLCVIHDDAMSYLAQHALDVVTRVRLDPDTKTVAPGALWREENLPTETVLVSLLAATGVGAVPWKELTELVQRPVQLGGKGTVGRGRCQLRLAAVPS